VAIVQGASKGIGRGIAEALAAEGCDLLLTARSAEPLREAAEAITCASGRRVFTAAADSADLAALEAQVRQVEREFGRLDIIVCNSGGPPPGAAMDLKPEQWAAAAQLLLTSPVTLLRHALPLLRKSPAPRFFIVTSSSTKQPVPGLTLSNVYRPGVTGLIKTLADELGADRIRCHSIAPGRFDTDRLGHVIKIQAEKGRKSEQEVVEAMKASIPAGRLGEPREIGDLVAFLASERADYLTGANWLVDGGLVKSI
jgi:3-oxoacyl-[acyl-carrier protein] reductase